MFRAWSSVLVVAGLVALAGCSSRASQESVVAGSSHLVSVTNAGPHDANVTLTMRLANGTVERATFSVKANETVQKRQLTLPNSTVQLLLSYSWDTGGHGSSGGLDLSYDARGCDHTYAISVRIETITGNTASTSTAGCQN